MTKIKMKAPLAYQGGKSKLAEQIVDKIWAGEEATYVDVCCGGGSISIELANRGAMNINMFDAGAMGAFWQMVSEGTFDINAFSDVIARIPADKNEIKGYLEGVSKITYTYVGEAIYEYLILQAGSFGGKQIQDGGTKFENCSFRGLWMPTATSSRRSPVNPMMPMPQSLLENIKLVVENMSFIRATHTLAEYIDFQRIKQESVGSVVTYIDPPYAGTTGYKHSLDIQELVKRAREVGDTYVSEYQLEGSDLSWELSKTTKGGINGNASKPMTERLFLFGC